MHKTVEQEHQLKLAIRDIVVRNPLILVHQLRRNLAERNFKTANGRVAHPFAGLRKGGIYVSLRKASRTP